MTTLRQFAADLNAAARANPQAWKFTLAEKTALLDRAEKSIVESRRILQARQSISTTADLFENLWDRCVDPTWFDEDDRPKIVEALKHLAARVPADIVEDFDVLVFAPSPWKNGQLYPRTSRPVIYLAPGLETLDQTEVDFVVAHEFAHHQLGHHDYANNAPTIEDEADSLVESWGFTIPLRRRQKQ